MAGNNSTTSENDINVCIAVLDNMQDTPKNIQGSFILLFVVIGVITFILNTIVIWAIVKTKEWENPSSKLILIGSVIL